jgi:hypothetical protein
MKPAFDTKAPEILTFSMAFGDRPNAKSNDKGHI